MITPIEPNLFYQENYQQNIKKVHPRVPFTHYEDDILKNLVIKYGSYNWKTISKYMPNRNPRQCRDRWLNYLSPDVVNGPWTLEEEELLVKKYEELGPSWKQIATFFPSRTDINIKSRWNLRERRLKKESLELTKELLIENRDKFPSSARYKKSKKQPLSKNVNMLPNILQQQNKNTSLCNQLVYEFQQAKTNQQFPHSNIPNKENTEKAGKGINSSPLPFCSDDKTIKNDDMMGFQLSSEEFFGSTVNDCVDFLLMNEENDFNDGYIDSLF
ncbi:hypothetical protein M9Y10_032895 [Tritrichomonas musculus]|uniref:Myb-like DNA-binding domain containing protein n=1 Tax=Tritrichomonas musculus TaxID=1915356 RepID=A0ABR2GY20_9EUKA